MPALLTRAYAVAGAAAIQRAPALVKQVQRSQQSQQKKTSIGVVAPAADGCCGDRQKAVPGEVEKCKKI